MSTATIQPRKKASARKEATDLDELLVLFPMTSDEFCELPPSESVKLELLDGKVYAMTRPSPMHQYFISKLHAVLTQWVEPKKLGRVLPDTLMKLDNRWTPAADLVFVAQRHLKRVKKKRIEGPVDLAIEVLSSNKQIDRGTKFVTYARFGIGWYWIVDLDGRVLEEYELRGNTYGSPKNMPFDQPFKPSLFPGLNIDLAALEW